MEKVILQSFKQGEALSESDWLKLRRAGRLFEVLHIDCFKPERHVKETLSIMYEAQSKGYPHKEGDNYIRRQHNKGYSTGYKISFEDNGAPVFFQAANYDKGAETILRTLSMNEPCPIVTDDMGIDTLISLGAGQTCMAIFAEDKVRERPRNVNFLIAFDANSNIIGANDKTGRVSYVSNSQIKEANSLPTPAKPNLPDAFR